MGAYGNNSRKMAVFMALFKFADSVNLLPQPTCLWEKGNGSDGGVLPAEIGLAALSLNL